MSVQALGWVFDHSPTTGSDRLVLLSLANHAGDTANGDGYEAYPSNETIGREAGLTREQTVKDAINRLIADGAITRVINGAPDERMRRDRRTNLCTILLDHGRACDKPRCTWCRTAGTRETSPRPTTRGDTDHGSPRDATGARETNERGHAKRENGGTRTEPLITRATVIESSLAAGEGEIDPFDQLFEALTAAVGVTPVTHSERMAFARAARELSRAGVTPADVAPRVAAYRHRWPNVVVTPAAITKHWSSLAPAAPRYSGGISDRPVCARCDGNSGWIHDDARNVATPCPDCNAAIRNCLDHSAVTS